MKTRFLPTAFLLACTLQMNAQPLIKKQGIFGGSKSEQAPSMCLTSDGGFIVAMESYSNISGNKSQNNHDLTGATRDYWVVKINASGTIQWDKSYGGADEDRPRAVIQTNDKGYMIAGYSYSGVSGDKSEPNRGISDEYTADLWIIKIDSLGNKQWDKTYGGSSEEGGADIKQTNDGGYILGGYSYSGISGEKTDVSRGSYDYWLVKLDENGEKQWDKTYGGDKSDAFVRLDLTSNGGYILGGTSNSSAYKEKSQASRGEQDYWVIKVNKKGEKEWDKTFGGSDIGENFEDIKATRDGGYIAGGFSSSNIGIDKSENSHGGYDYWLIKIDATGQKQWDRTIGGSDNDQLYALAQTKDKGYILAGYSYSEISGDKTEPLRKRRPNLFSPDYWVVKTDSLGKVNWDKTIGGDLSDACYNIKEITANTYLLGGISDSKQSYDKTLPSIGRTDFWPVILKYNDNGTVTTTNISTQNVNSKLDKDFTVYPNPAKDILKIQATGKATLILSDQSGKIILTKSINGTEAINVSHLPAGLYYLKNNETGVVQKIIITK